MKNVENCIETLSHVEKKKSSKSICLKYKHHALTSDELDSCDNILNKTRHSKLSVLPNHSINRRQEMNGFFFECHANDQATVLPMPKHLFDVTAIYEVCTQNSSGGLNVDAIKISEHLSQYSEILTGVIKELKSRQHEEIDFDCIQENDTQHVENESYMKRHLIDRDARVWCESIPDTVGIYHAFLRTNANESRKHKLYIVVKGNLATASQNFYNFWEDCREHVSCKDIVESEEIEWLKRNTLRNHNRLALKIAQSMKLNVMKIIDIDHADEQQSHHMALPSTFTFNQDLDIIYDTDKIRYSSECCFLDKQNNGVLYHVSPREGFWLFCGPYDHSESNTFGGNFRDTATMNMFPTSTVQYHKFYPCQAAQNSIYGVIGEKDENIITDSVSAEHYLFPDDHLLNICQELGFDRNDEIVNLMPLITFVR